MKNPGQEFAAIVAKLCNQPGVTPPSDEAGTSRKFGSNGLRINGKVFAMLSPEKKLIVKLPRTRVEALVNSGDGVQFDPRHDGRLMKEWLVLNPTSRKSWLELAKEAVEFTGSSKTNR